MICRKCKASVPDGQFCIQCGAAQEIQRKRRHRGNGQGTVYQLPNGTWRAEINIYANGLRIRRTKAGFTLWCSNSGRGKSGWRSLSP